MASMENNFIVREILMQVLRLSLMKSIKNQEFFNEVVKMVKKAKENGENLEMLEFYGKEWIDKLQNNSEKKNYLDWNLKLEDN